MIGYGVAGVGVELWAAHVMNGLLSHQVVQTGLEGVAGTLRFRLSPGMFPIESNLVVGCLVLVMAEVFRQGLALKTETDLTV
ncbi:MAG: DUF2975 domain-containing protein [Opitutales bacterium]